MSLDELGMHRAGLAFVYRIVPVLVATSLYGIYFAILCVATRGLLQRGLKHPANAIILLVLYMVFLLSSALWALEVAQLFGLVEMLLSPNGLSTDALFNRFYDLVARESRITGILFDIQVSPRLSERSFVESDWVSAQMIVGDVLVIWRASAIWFEKKSVVLLPLFWWALTIINMIVQASFCHSGVATTNYGKVCKATNILAPTLSITTNISVMIIILWKVWLLRDKVMDVWHRRKSNKVFTVFVLCVESGTLYVVMLITDLLVTSLVTGGNETVGRMVDCISGYSTVQLVGIYPTLMLVVLRESVWNASEETGYTLNVSTAHFATRPSLGDISSRTADPTSRRVQFSTIDDVDVDLSALSPMDRQRRHDGSTQPLDALGAEKDDVKLAQL
ncbi:hypothetical protein PHLGIDRAFT_122215 [Phlebiopsis gigantea 11061_1 CR5-6]|uniref:Uncharacterized protein n=1 Tax=Phlebiopsis gigantea (strain 11061_1 CR5-6) TaxID=745531 RepID=A0A0C3S0X1_PHLG1|nr:hypothetical protein PHLGIDRAFT_122215 [Phlebiopsis gigantea 11061_1 CR5-6]